MEEIGMFEAKTRFSQIVKRVQATGRGVRITRRGEPVVEITPIRPTPNQKRSRREVVAEITRLRDTLPKSDLAQIQRDIAEGRT